MTHPLPSPHSLPPTQPQADFGWALGMLREGKRVRRRGWNGKGMWVAMQEPDVHSANTLPYLFMRTTCGNRVPWLASHTDVLADDWELAAG